VRESYSRRDKDNFGRMLEGYTYYTYETCTIALDDSRNWVSGFTSDGSMIISGISDRREFRLSAYASASNEVAKIPW